MGACPLWLLIVEDKNGKLTWADIRRFIGIKPSGRRRRPRLRFFRCSANLCEGRKARLPPQGDTVSPGCRSRCRSSFGSGSLPGDDVIYTHSTAQSDTRAEYIALCKQGVRGQAQAAEQPLHRCGVLATRMADDGLKNLAFIERPDEGGDHVHQLALLAFQIVGE